MNVKTCQYFKQTNYKVTKPVCRADREEPIAEYFSSKYKKAFIFTPVNYTS